jgi:hypothetical protein
LIKATNFINPTGMEDTGIVNKILEEIDDEEVSAESYEERNKIDPGLFFHQFTTLFKRSVICISRDTVN